MGHPYQLRIRSETASALKEHVSSVTQKNGHYILELDVETFDALAAQAGTSDPEQMDVDREVIKLLR